MELARDFVRYVRDGVMSVSCTSIEDSMKGHLTVFRADKSMKNGGEVEKVIE